MTEKTDFPLFEVVSDTTFKPEAIGLKLCEKCKKLVSLKNHTDEACRLNIVEAVTNR